MPSPTKEAMRCHECESDDTELTFHVDRDGRQCRFRVECLRHGGFSHFLQPGLFEDAVLEYLRAAKLIKVTT